MIPPGTQPADSDIKYAQAPPYCASVLSMLPQTVKGLWSDRTANTRCAGDYAALHERAKQEETLLTLFLSACEIDFHDAANVHSAQAQTRRLDEILMAKGRINYLPAAWQSFRFMTGKGVRGGSSLAFPELMLTGDASLERIQLTDPRYTKGIRS